MSLNGAVTNLASWAGNTMMPTMAGMFFAGAVYRYSKSGPFEHLLYGGFASLMCSGVLRALEGFVQNAGPTNADVFWMATMSLVNWTVNVILPMFALTQLAAMALHMGGVVSEIYPGSTWIRKFVAAVAALMVSGIVRLAESNSLAEQIGESPFIAVLDRLQIDSMTTIPRLEALKALVAELELEAARPAA